MMSLDVHAHAHDDDGGGDGDDGGDVYVYVYVDNHNQIPAIPMILLIRPFHKDNHLHTGNHRPDS
jgi:hypothetical protein